MTGPAVPWAAVLGWAGAALLGALVVLRVIAAGLTARVPAGEQQLVGGAVAALRGSSVGPLTGWLGEFATRAQLTGYAALTGAFDRYTDPIDAARELAAVAALVTVVALVALAWRLRLHPGAVAAGLALLAVAGPAGLALGTFGPGQLGVMWLVVSAALLAQAGAGPRALGAIAAGAGVLTAPALALPAAVAVVVAAIGGRLARPAVTGPRGLVVAGVVAGLGGTAAVVFSRLPIAPSTTALDPAGQLWLITAAALAVVAGIVLRERLPQAAAVAAAVLLGLVGWQYPGADTLLPALAVAVPVLAAALLSQLAQRRRAPAYVEPSTRWMPR